MTEGAAAGWGWDGADDCTHLITTARASGPPPEARVRGTQLLIRTGDQAFHVDLRDVLHAGRALTGLFKFRSSCGEREESIPNGRGTYPGVQRAGRGYRFRPTGYLQRAAWRFRAAGMNEGFHGATPTAAITACIDAVAAAAAADAAAADVVCTGERTWAERDAALRANAIELDP